jgi:hypothetical protein
MSAQEIHHKINRNLKHVSVIACISTAGESPTPNIVTSQDSLPIRKNRKTRCPFRYRFHSERAFKTLHQCRIFHRLYSHRVPSQSKPTANSPGIFRWRCVTFDGQLPEHVTDEVLGLLQDAWVRIIAWSLIRLKSFSSSIPPFLELRSDEGSTNYPLMRKTKPPFLFDIYRTFKQTMIKANIWDAFQE